MTQSSCSNKIYGGLWSCRGCLSVQCVISQRPSKEKALFVGIKASHLPLPNSTFRELKPHNLVAATAVGNRVFILGVSANGRQWRKGEEKLRHIQRSFRVPVPEIPPFEGWLMLCRHVGFPDNFHLHYSSISIHWLHIAEWVYSYSENRHLCGQKSTLCSWRFAYADVGCDLTLSMGTCKCYFWVRSIFCAISTETDRSSKYDWDMLILCWCQLVCYKKLNRSSPCSILQN